MYEFRVRCIEVDEAEKKSFEKDKIYSNIVKYYNNGSVLFLTSRVRVYLNAKNGMQATRWKSKFRLVTAQNGTAS